MKTIIATVAILLLPATAFADGHNGHGQGFSSTVSSTTIEGKSGSIIHMVSEDIWHYQKAPEGWPTAAMDLSLHHADGSRTASTFID